MLFIRSRFFSAHLVLSTFDFEYFETSSVKHAAAARQIEFLS